MKSASAKRPPDEAHGAPEKKLSSRSEFENPVQFRQAFLAREAPMKPEKRQKKNENRKIETPV